VTERPLGFDRDDPMASQDDRLLRTLLSELAAGRESAPDLTDAVMGRLGFVRCTEQEARAERRSRLLRRAAVMMLAVFAALGGYALAASRMSSDSHIALASAVGGAVERRSQCFEVFVRGLPRVQTDAVHAPEAASWFGLTGVPPVPILLVPVPCDEAGPYLPEDFEFEWAVLRRKAAVTPFPQT